MPAYLRRASKRIPTKTLEVVQRQVERLEQAARNGHGAGFARCSPEVQDGLLQTWSQGDPEARRVLAWAIRTCLEGFLGHPRHGGNQGRLGWIYLGLEEGTDPEACMHLPPGIGHP